MDEDIVYKDLGEFNLVISPGLSRMLRFVRIVAAFMDALLTSALLQVAPGWFAVLIGVLASVGVVALFEEMIFSSTLKPGKPGAK